MKFDSLLTRLEFFYKKKLKAYVENKILKY